MFGTQEGLLYHFQWSKLLGLDMHTQFLAATRVGDRALPIINFCQGGLAVVNFGKKFSDW